MEAGVLHASEQGTPQGGILSPVLANIYLHYVLDLWFIHRVKRQSMGYGALIRYADDFVILTRYEEDARMILEQLKGRLSTFELELSVEKTRLIEFGRFAEERANRTGRKPDTFDFLGFTHYVSKSRTGKFKGGRKTSGNKYRGNLQRMNKWLNAPRNLLPLDELWKRINLKLNGYYRYYGVSENYSSISRYHFNVVRLVFKWLNRRSQKRRFSWETFNKYLAKYPLSRPKIYHNRYEFA